MNSASLSPLDNSLLASLPRADFGLIQPHLSLLALDQGTRLLDAGEEVDAVYFPVNGMLSLLVAMRDGRAIETSTVGREGAVGAMAGLGLYVSRVKVVVQLPTVIGRIPAAQFRKAVAASPVLRDLCIHFNETLLTQARITAACNALHQVDARFCRWLLQTVDRAESDTLALTQELLSQMLGVRRTSVTEVAGRFQAEGLISYSRGVIRILDRPALEARACECYETLKAELRPRRRG